MFVLNSWFSLFCTWLYSCWLVGRSVSPWQLFWYFFTTIRHNCSCPIAHDCSAMYPALILFSLQNGYFLFCFFIEARFSATQISSILAPCRNSIYKAVTDKCSLQMLSSQMLSLQMLSLQIPLTNVVLCYPMHCDGDIFSTPTLEQL